MPIKTIAVDAARARGWTKADLARMTGLSLSTIYSLSRGTAPSAKATAAIMRVFPDMPYERLFVPIDSSALHIPSSKVQAKGIAA